LLVETKYCPKCGETKKLTEFFRNKTKKDGLTSWCKECTGDYNRKYSKQRYSESKWYKEQQAKYIPLELTGEEHRNRVDFINRVRMEAVWKETNAWCAV